MPAPSELEIIRIGSHGTLTDHVVQALRNLIRTHDLASGSRLPTEMTMAARFGVSRTVVREALSRLKSAGLIESRQGSGAFVCEADPHPPFRIDPAIMQSLPSVLQVIELRKALEGEIAGLAAERRSKGQLAEIRRAFRSIDSETRAGRDGVEADLGLHASIASASGNPHFPALLAFLATYLKNAVQIARGYEATDLSLALEARREHSEIIAAIAARDPESARQAARRHMEGAARRISTFAVERSSLQGAAGQSGA